MKLSLKAAPLAVLLSLTSTLAFQSPDPLSSFTSARNSRLAMDRRGFGNALVGTAAATLWNANIAVSPANAQVFFDPAMYGDQELRVGAVDSVRESVRRAILKNPQLAPSFYQLALLDGLSFDSKTQKYGPDGSILKVVLSTKADDAYTKNLQQACLTLIEAEKNLRKKVAITIADAIAIGGSQSIESIGGPVLAVQLGRADAPIKAPVSDVPIDLFSGKRDFADVQNAFRNAGLTDREMTALLSGLLTLEYVEKTRTVEDWKQSARPRFREPGKMGRLSEFKPLTDDDIAQAELESDPEYEDPDDGWYIADSFGSRESRFGDRLAKDQINEKTFNKYLKDIAEKSKKQGPDAFEEYGWIAMLVMDKDSPTSSTWLNKYAGSNLSYIKDLSISYNSLTQLGAVYTGGKYENLLKNKPRKSLNDDDLKLF
ncbi:hypothetical protein with heme peroxidase domain [Phaeodactylum tricornutum CCAP 1055/1]|jgi:hypothetical protein|uniref:Plant heme peroxidase family profile domain-containing protein n=1 Tax=Phaeodactylum tricornutum (strain CCAP 1055/1) TaxID=556484 RepID=B7G6K8_PHATC|nr:hypothetical protein with heme peroxidase domain [Phaeodactylum tricornutum CCAP 1055/1]EEC46033.1 hypothetical protein with heme peroxidase domain [Phaeodactylum tricornutum CCAP 1055/1]|eukprot:XP_002182746.1 hypothetical protein with heme peroxidase domain [Phaeodactylum tricornutum CCAP 1055/1]